MVGSFEEAALIALGEMFYLYGSDAAPMQLEVTGEIVTRHGRPVWRLDGIYEVTIGNEPRQERWILWIGPTDGAPLAVLAVSGPA